MNMKPDDVAVTPTAYRFEDYLAYESSADVVDRKLYQAAALSAMLYGGGLQPFLENRETIQDGVLWLLHDTICGAIAARSSTSQATE
ncbi:hypothetical protein [Dyella sp. 2HG41-7]|uniref:hypothetical protein n=1 Tax=Dyella sp. 2HG41-7 TaxID=2883239 RepID=UPI001F169019|nr:hypothetical protein [Dyella sp. 2HG41-7]